MPAERLLPTTEAEDLLKLAREIARDELAPIASSYEEEHRFPREQFRLLGSRRRGCPLASGFRCT
jgi:alkylation response protein AidB-like acyl-CoA dehydrogenase